MTNTSPSSVQPHTLLAYSESDQFDGPSNSQTSALSPNQPMDQGPVLQTALAGDPRDIWNVLLRTGAAVVDYITQPRAPNQEPSSNIKPHSAVKESPCPPGTAALCCIPPELLPSEGGRQSHKLIKRQRKSYPYCLFCKLTPIQ